MNTAPWIFIDDISDENAKYNIAILWDDQLWAFTAEEAQKMGHNTMIFWNAGKNAPAAQVSNSTWIVFKNTKEAVDKIISWNPDVVTSEWENIPVDLIRAIEEKWIKIYPSSKNMDIIQDRRTEKEAIVEAWWEVVEYIWEINNEKELKDAFEKLWPGILKTVREGYDWKWQILIRSKYDIRKLLLDDIFDWIVEPLWKVDRIYEGLVDFDYELSVIVARSPKKKTIVYEPAHNVHKNGILSESIIPAKEADIEISDEIIEKAKLIAKKITIQMWIVWLLVVEMFVKDGEIIINELAPRPHNSGHGTMESYNISQYWALVTAILNEDFEKLELLYKTHLHNLLWDDIRKIISDRRTYGFKSYMNDIDGSIWYDYGKEQLWKGKSLKFDRKMWHMVYVSDI